MGKKEKAAGKDVIRRIREQTRCNGLHVEVVFSKRKTTVILRRQFVSGRQIDRFEMEHKNPAIVIERAVEHYRACVKEYDRARSARQLAEERGMSAEPALA